MSKEPDQNKMSKLRRRGARMARSEEGTYQSVCNQRETMAAGMDRRRKGTDYFERATKECRA